VIFQDQSDIHYSGSTKVICGPDNYRDWDLSRRSGRGMHRERITKFL